MAKRIVICLIILGLFFSALSITACNNSTYTTAGLQFEKIDGKKEYRVFNLVGNDEGELVIPSEHNGLPVTEIADNAFHGKTAISTVYIPDSVTKIGKRAFYECRNLQSIVLPSSLQAISSEMFVNCHKLLEITIPDSVITINSKAFAGSGLKQVIIPNNVQKIAWEAFKSCVNLESVVIGESVDDIQPYAFAYCFNLTSATFLDPHNWTLTGIVFKENALASPQDAASFLTDETYLPRIWEKS